MGYQALLFCPDEKTARTVTQVLSELDFNVESCTEPFAAVKKLMGQHFDAVVVDCDNEQNATLLFKSARNSTSNQGSLAVAVVEGQAGVAKAFRIGANLVLTKPINIEQAKGTLRVARGLLRKGEPLKPVAEAMATSPAPTVADKPAPAARPEAPAVPAVPTTPVPTKSGVNTLRPAPVPVAAAKAAEQDEDLLDIGEKDSVAAPSAPAPVAPPANKFITPAPQADKFLAAALASPTPAARAASNAAAFSKGAASAPAPARERQDAQVADTLFERPAATADAPLKTTEAAPRESSGFVGSAPTFSFGGANAPAESSGAGKKLLVGVAAVVILAAAAYVGWSHFQRRAPEPETAQTETTAAPATTSPVPKPSTTQHQPAVPAPKPSASLPSSQNGPSTAKSHASGNSDSAADASGSPSAPSSTKSSSSPSSDVSKTADADEAAAEPIVVKAGKSPLVHNKAGAVDAPEPSIIGIATAGASAPPPDLGSTSEIAPKPMLQSLNVSQGVSRGLLFKKVQPVYPRTALSMRIEGSVELMATISKTGDIASVKVLSGDSHLTTAATEAVKQWKYKPYLLNGEPVEIQTQVTINFKLPK
jgi:protein TonB